MGRQGRATGKIPTQVKGMPIMSEILWQPSEEQIKQTNMYRFIQYVNGRYHLSISDYQELYQWSVEQIPEFWAAMWDFADIIHSRPYERVVDDLSKMPGAEWFVGARLNFAENLLRYRDDETAIIFKGENQTPTRLTYAELYDEVAQVAAVLKELGVQPGERVVGYMP